MQQVAGTGVISTAICMERMKWILVIKTKDIAFKLICIGIFVTPHILRLAFFKTQWAIVNVIAWLGIIFLLRRYVRQGRVQIAKRSNGGIGNPLWICLLIACFIICAIGISTFSYESLVKYIYATLAPLILLYVTVPFEENDKQVICFCNYLTASCTFIVLMGLLDIIFGTGFGKFIADYTQTESLFELLRTGRMVSYVGHSLLSTELMLLCFLFNTLKHYYIKKNEPIALTVYNCVMPAIGIGLCGSKTGFVLFAISFAVLYVNRKGLKYVILIIAAIYWALSMGFFDSVLHRFEIGLSMGDLSTGRNTNLVLLWKSGALDFHFLTGHAGTTLSEKMIAALEYPPLRWAYLFGVWFSVAMCSILFVIPIFKCIKYKKFKVLFALLIIIADVNSYNGITTLSDQMLIYCVSVLLLLNLARRTEYNE